MDNKRGFITVATGDYYCWLAQNLAMSYRLFSERKYPFYAITDREGAKKLEKYFDGLVVLDKPYYSYQDKMTVYHNTPFEETVFIDADADIVDDISFLFDDFKANGSDMSCIGTVRRITPEKGAIHFGAAAVQKFGLDSYVSFNGGVYYFRKSEKVDGMLDFIFNELIPNYGKYDMLYFRGNQMADEPLFGLAMMCYGMKPLDSEKDIMKFAQNVPMLTWDMKAKKCAFVWYGMNVSPLILHFGTHATYSRKYVYYNEICRLKYKKIPKLFYPPVIAFVQIRLYFKCLTMKSYRNDMWDWFKGHFSLDYLKFTFNRIAGKSKG